MSIRSQLLSMLPAFILAVILLVQLVWGGYAPSGIDDARSGGALPAALQFRLPPIDQAYTEMLDRPINLPNRRQPPLPGVKINEPAATPVSIIKFRLVGIVMSEGNNLALIQETANGRMRTLKVGETVNGMQLEKVESGKITFRKGATVQELSLTIDTNK